MKVNARPAARRTQAERTAATRARLLEAGRHLFAADGYAAVPTQAIVDAAGVTRGALYHQFGDKSGLFAEVYEDVERDLVTRISSRIVAAEPVDQLAAMRTGARLFLAECSAPDVQRIVLIDAPDGARAARRSRRGRPLRVEGHRCRRGAARDVRGVRPCDQRHHRRPLTGQDRQAQCPSRECPSMSFNVLRRTSETMS